MVNLWSICWLRRSTTAAVCPGNQLNGKPVQWGHNTSVASRSCCLLLCDVMRSLETHWMKMIWVPYEYHPELYCLYWCTPSVMVQNATDFVHMDINKDLFRFCLKKVFFFEEFFKKTTKKTFAIGLVRHINTFLCFAPQYPLATDMTEPSLSTSEGNPTHLSCC